MLKIARAALAALFFCALATVASQAQQRQPVTVAMDRTQGLQGMNPQTPWWLNVPQRDTRLGFGQFIYDALSRNGGGFYVGLSVTPGSGLNVVVAPSVTNTQGAVYQLNPDDTLGYGGFPSGVNPGALPADPTLIFVQGLTKVALPGIGPLNGPGTAGQSVDYLIECQVQEIDTTSTPISVVAPGGGITSTVGNRDRNDVIGCQSKSGTPATTGSQVAPSPDAGWVAVSVVAVANGAVIITSPNITPSPQWGGFAQLGPTGFLPIAAGGTNNGSFTGATCIRYNGTALVSAGGDCVDVLSNQTITGVKTFSSGSLAFSSGTVSTCLGLNASRVFAPATNCIQSVSFTGNMSNAGTTLNPIVSIVANPSFNAVTANLLTSNGALVTVGQSITWNGSCYVAGAYGTCFEADNLNISPNAVSTNQVSVPAYGVVIGSTGGSDFQTLGVQHQVVVDAGLNLINIANATAGNFLTNGGGFLGGASFMGQAPYCGTGVQGIGSDTWGWGRSCTINMALDASGDLGGAGFAKFASYQTPSDRRLKTNIRPLVDCVSDVMKLKPSSFDWKSTGKHDMGFIAQEVQAIFPELIVTTNDGFLSLDYSRLTSPLACAIREQQLHLGYLDVNANAVDVHVAALERRVGTLESNFRLALLSLGLFSALNIVLLILLISRRKSA